MTRDVAASAVGDVVVGDEELSNAAKQLATHAIATALEFLQYGSTQVRLKIVTSLLPSIGKALAQGGEDEEMAEMRAQLRRLQQAMLDAS